LPARVGMDDDVVDVEQRPGGEGRKTGEAVDQANRLFAPPGQCAVKGRQALQFIDQMCSRISGESFAATHRVAGVVVEQVEPDGGICLVLEVDRSNAKIMAHDKRTVT